MQIPGQVVKQVSARRSATTIVALVSVLVLAAGIATHLAGWQGADVYAIGLTLLITALLVLIGRFPDRPTLFVFGLALAAAPDVNLSVHVRGFFVTPRILVLLLLLVSAVFAHAQNKIQVPGSGLLIGLCISVGVTSVLADNAYGFIQFGVLMALPFIVGAGLGRRSDWRDQFACGVLVGVLLLVVIALVERIVNRDFLLTSADQVNFTRSGTVRANAGWSYPTTFATFLCTVSFLVVERARRRGQLAGSAVVLVVLVGVVLSQSRASLLGLSFGAAVYIVLQPSLRTAAKNLIPLIGIAVGFILLPISYASEFRSYIGGSFTPGDTANGTITYRETIYSIGKSVVATRPWFGFGFGSTQAIDKNVLGQYFGNFSDIASLPLSLAIQIGIVGAGFFFAMEIAIIVRCVARRRASSLRCMAASLVAALCSFLGESAPSALLWLMLVTGIAYGSLRELSERLPEAHAADTPDVILSTPLQSSDAE